MNALSLWNPYAALLISGAKKIETRSWSTNFRGWIGIIATKGGLPLSDFAALIRREPFMSAIAALGYRSISDFPSGLIGAVRLGPCERVLAHPRAMLFAGGNITIPPPEPERSFGDYTPGRFAWMTIDRIACKEPVPWKGGQRWVTGPDDVVWKACGGRPGDRLNRT